MTLQTAGPGRRLTTITVSTNECSWLVDCLTGLTTSHVGPDLELDVLVVDNACTDGTTELLATRFPGVRVIRSEARLGFAEANNLGIQAGLAGGSDYVFLVNPDTRSPTDLVRRLVDFLEEWPEYGIVGPLQYRYTEDGSHSPELNDWSVTALAAGENDVFAADGSGHPSSAGAAEGRAPRTLEHPYVQGSALVARAEVFTQVGQFDPTYQTYYEETDLCRRTRWAGWRVALLLDLGLQHYGGGGTRGSAYWRRHMQRNKFYFLFTDPDRGVGETWRLTVRWVGDDLGRRGAAPATSRTEAVVDSLLGWAWLVAQAPRVIARRRAHRVLRRSGGRGPVGPPVLSRGPRATDRSS